LVFLLLDRRVCDVAVDDAALVFDFHPGLGGVREGGALGCGVLCSGLALGGGALLLTLGARLLFELFGPQPCEPLLLFLSPWGLLPLSLGWGGRFEACWRRAAGWLFPQCTGSLLVSGFVAGTLHPLGHGQVGRLAALGRVPTLLRQFF
jgi:hypothetical protein